MSTAKINHEDVFHPDTAEFGIATGFWWLEGSPLTPIYCATMLWRTKRKKTLTASYRATSGYALATALTEAGWEAPDNIAWMCESAGCSRQIARNRSFQSEVDSHV